MLNYTITEDMRQEILHMLEWAEYGIDEAKSWNEAERKAGWESRSLDEINRQRAALGAVWDALNALQPVDDEYGTGDYS